MATLCRQPQAPSSAPNRAEQPISLSEDTAAPHGLDENGRERVARRPPKSFCECQTQGDNVCIPLPVLLRSPPAGSLAGDHSAKANLSAHSLTPTTTIRKRITRFMLTWLAHHRFRSTAVLQPRCRQLLRQLLPRLVGSFDPNSEILKHLIVLSLSGRHSTGIVES